MKVFNFIFFIFISLFSSHFSYAANEWEEHSNKIIILDTNEVKNIVDSKSAILLDVWKKDIKPETLDQKNGCLFSDILYQALNGSQMLG